MTVTLIRRPVAFSSAALIALPFVEIVAACVDGVNASWIGRSSPPIRGVLLGLAPGVAALLQAANTRLAASAHPNGPRSVLRMDPLLFAEPSLSYSAELTFLAKLSAAQRAHDSILCVGLDPEPASIPESLGRGPQAAVRFLRRIVLATAPHVCAYKPNLAFYERYGSAAMDVLALTLQAIPADIPLFLMPGVGSQGGDVGLALRAAMDTSGAGVLPSASRSVLYASRGDDFANAATEAARTLRDAANAARAAETAPGR